MLHKYDLPFEWKQIASLLEAADLRNEIKQLSFNPNKLKQNVFIEEIFDSLEAKQKLLPYNISFQLIYLFQHDKYILFEPHYHFNKYRLFTLRSDFYQEITPNFDLLKYKNYCRTKHEEAIKSGLRVDVWQDEIGDNIFGRSEDPGYFGGNGSSGWKYIALCNFLFDLFVQSKNIDVYRISPYENLMIDGKLFTINSLLNSSEERYIKALQQFFIRSVRLSPA